MIKCINCIYNKEAKNIGEHVRWCNFSLPVGFRREDSGRIYDEKNQGCDLGKKK